MPRLAVQQQQQERRDHRNRLWNLRARARAEETRLSRDRATRRLADDIEEAERTADAALLAEALRSGEPRRRPVRPPTEARAPQVSPLQTPRKEEAADQNIGRRRRGDPPSAEDLMRRHQHRLRIQREWRARVQAPAAASTSSRQTATQSPASVSGRDGKKARQTAGHGAGTTPSGIGRRAR
uniref:Uncharacterized protein n=1 Tax=Anopheles farauti TaxID=69004 RepID=A0A182QRP2_9DIPT